MNSAKPVTSPFESDLDAETTALIRSSLLGPASAYPLRILYVDDSMISREVVRVILSRAGHSVFCSVDGITALQTLKKVASDLDLVITDHDMPGINGLDVVQFLRAIAFSGGIMVHSGSLNTHLLAEYRKLGVQHFLMKPASASELLSEVARVTAPE